MILNFNYRRKSSNYISCFYCYNKVQCLNRQKIDLDPTFLNAELILVKTLTQGLPTMNNPNEGSLSLSLSKREFSNFTTFSKQFSSSPLNCSHITNDFLFTFKIQSTYMPNVPRFKNYSDFLIQINHTICDQEQIV